MSLSQSELDVGKMIGNRLFDHDRRVALNAMRATFAGWFDRLLAVALIITVLAGARAWALDRSWPAAAWAGLGVGAMIGLSTGRGLRARLAFHGCDGVLAAEAAQPFARRRYLAAWHLVALAAVIAATVVAGPLLPVATVPGYIMGALAGHGFGAVIQPRAGSGRAASVRGVRAWRRRPLAGGGAGVVLILVTMVLGRPFDVGVSTALVGVVSAIVAVMLSGVDDAVVRFMTATGWSAARIVAHHARAPLLFTTLAVPAAGLLLTGTNAVAVGAVSAGALLLMTIRVLAYRLYPRRAADVVVSVLVAMLVLVVAAGPIALPLAVTGILWHLHRRAAAATWLMA